MPLAQNSPKITHFEINEGLRYALLDLEEFGLHFISDDKRVMEKAAALHVVREVLQNKELEIFYQESGKPYLEHEVHISISHSYNYLVVLFSKAGGPGVDIEKVRDKVILIRRKFLSAQELQHLQNASPDEHTVYWCAKEALYKASGISGLIFAEQLFVEPFTFSKSGGEIRAQLNHPDSEKKHTLRYVILGEHILVYTINDLE